MSEVISIDTALKLPAPDIEALLLGRTILARPQIFVEENDCFALCPASSSTSPLMLEHYYLPHFIEAARTAFESLDSDKIAIQAWAKCETCQIIDVVELDRLVSTGIWSLESFEELLNRGEYIFLASFRVYRLENPIFVPISPNVKNHFIGLPEMVITNNENPVLSDKLFARRKYQLKDVNTESCLELEKLHDALTQLTTKSEEVVEFEHNIKFFLGWTDEKLSDKPDSDLDWIDTIEDLGNRSKEEEEISNYEAGTKFENVVRLAVEFLGFKVDYFHRGGPGGLDLFCSSPYSLVGECKAGKSIPNPTAIQLLNLATLRLPDAELIKRATKLIIGPGKPARQLEDAANLHGMSIINPHTLENLVKLNREHHGSVDLFKLRDCLKPGRTDADVQKYIGQVRNEIKVRSQLVQAAKQLTRTDKTQLSVVEIRTYYNVKFTNDARDELNDSTVYDLLIELSSPLTGYLGRISVGTGLQTDRFYFLRDLNIEQ